MLDTLRQNFASPLTLSFALGVIARLVKSEFSLPRDIYAAISIYLLFALGLKGGVELSQSSWDVLFWPAAATLLLGCMTPLTSYFVLRRLGRFSVANAAGIAAHYGSVSAVTFLAAQQFVLAMGQPLEGFLPTLLTLLESPGIHIALAIGAIQSRAGLLSAPLSPAIPHGADPPHPTRGSRQVLHEVLTARSMVLLVGGLLVGAITGESGYEPVKPFFEGLFKGVLTIFLLEMGVVAASRLGELRHAGAFLIGFGVVMPILHGGLAVALGDWAGLSVGGCTVLAAMAASASYIAAPPAVRMTLPEANPTYYLTASLAITFPFNLLAGIPLYYQMAKWMG